MGELNNAAGGLGGGGGNPANRKPFTKSGQFVVPDGVKTVYVTAVAGGGGGLSDSRYTTTKGGNTKFGTLLELEGGKGGEARGSRGNPQTMVITAPANTDHYQYPGGVGGLGRGTPGSACGDKSGGTALTTYTAGGGASCISDGGNALRGLDGRSYDDVMLPFVVGYGSGAGSPAGSNYGTTGGNAGAGVIDIPIPVTPGEIIDIEIGASGRGDTNRPETSRYAYDGGPGYLLVKW